MSPHGADRDHGSSNTERTGNIGNAQNWVDWLDSGLRWWYGRFHVTINVGISGEPGAQSLARFAEDVEKFDPFLVIITCGGNDANPTTASRPPISAPPSPRWPTGSSACARGT